MSFPLDLNAAVALFAGVGILVYLGRVLLNGSTSSAGLPPGPKPIPFVGNLHQLAHSRQWLQFYEWSKKYGPVMYLNMAGQPFVVLSSDKAAQDLLSRRGSQYSDRPRRVMVWHPRLRCCSSVANK